MADKPSAARIRLRLGDVCRQLEDFSAATTWYRAAEKEALRSRLPALALDAACGRAMSLRGMHRYDEAVALFQRLLTAYRRRRDGAGEAYALWALGTTARFAGRLRDAEAHLRSAIRRYRALSDPQGLAYAECALGGTLRMLDRPAESGLLYARAARTFRRHGDAFGVAYSSCGRGNAHRMRGQFAKALPFMNRAIAGYQRLRLWGPLGFVFWSRAQLQLLKGNFEGARADLRLSETSFRRSDDPRGIVYVLLGRGEWARAVGKGAEGPFQRAEQAARRMNLPLETLHARVRLGSEPATAYRQFGIAVPAYLGGRTLP